MEKETRSKWNAIILGAAMNGDAWKSLKPFSIMANHSWLFPGTINTSFLCYKVVFEKWNNFQKLKFVISFGDIVNRFCPKVQSLNVVENLVDEFKDFYWSYLSHDRLVVLDGYDISVIGWSLDHLNALEALKFL